MTRGRHVRKHRREGKLFKRAQVREEKRLRRRLTQGKYFRERENKSQEGNSMREEERRRDGEQEKEWKEQRRERKGHVVEGAVEREKQQRYTAKDMGGKVQVGEKGSKQEILLRNSKGESEALGEQSAKERRNT